MIKTSDQWIYAEDFCTYKGLDFKDFVKNKLVVKYVDALIVAHNKNRTDFIRSGKISWELAELFANFTGEKSIVKSAHRAYALKDYLDRDVQIELSKKVNDYLVEKSGVKSATDYNRRSAREVTGFRPADLKLMAKAKGEPVKNFKSGKEFIRKTNPHFAAIMAVSDDLVTQGVEQGKAMKIARDLEQYFVTVSQGS